MEIFAYHWCLESLHDTSVVFFNTLPSPLNYFQQIPSQVSGNDFLQRFTDSLEDKNESPPCT